MGGWSAREIPDQSGRVAVVTGANSGLGYITARELARKGATVVLACRSDSRAQNAQQRLRKEVPDAQTEIRLLDLADLRSIRRFAEGFPYDRLDLLVNNAGVMGVTYGTTADGFETQFGVNHLGHFALTGLLLPRVLAAGVEGGGADGAGVAGVAGVGGVGSAGGPVAAEVSGGVGVAGGSGASDVPATSATQGASAPSASVSQGASEMPSASGVPSAPAPPAAPRIVNVSSIMHAMSNVDLRDPNGLRSYHRWTAYARSKSAVLLFTHALAGRLAEAGAGVVVAAAHPGYAATGLSSGVGGRAGRALMEVGDKVLAQPAEVGALPLLYAATAPGVRPDSFTGPSFALWRGAPAPSWRAPRTRDDRLAEWLWEVSERLTGVAYGERLGVG